MAGHGNFDLKKVGPNGASSVSATKADTQQLEVVIKPKTESDPLRLQMQQPVKCALLGAGLFARDSWVPIFRWKECLWIRHI